MRLSIGTRTQRLIAMALEEDAVSLDTSAGVFPDDEISTADLVAKESLVVAGQPVAEAVFEAVDGSISYRPRIDECDAVESGAVIGTVRGPTTSLLQAERTALNFLQRLCGIATKTSHYVEALDDPTTAIVDTRKTLPGFRELDKYAVRCGGGENHRFNLAGGIIVKDNHIEAAGSIRDAVGQIRRSAPHTLKIEVEVESLDGLDEALDAGADIVMLDNMSTDTMSRAIERVRDRADEDVFVEASGNITLDRLPELGGLGLDFISSGSLTHSVEAADISMQFES